MGGQQHKTPISVPPGLVREIRCVRRFFPIELHPEPARQRLVQVGPPFDHGRANDGWIGDAVRRAGLTSANLYWQTLFAAPLLNDGFPILRVIPSERAYIDIQAHRGYNSGSPD